MINKLILIILLNGVKVKEKAKHQERGIEHGNR